MSEESGETDGVDLLVLGGPEVDVDGGEAPVEAAPQPVRAKKKATLRVRVNEVPEPDYPPIPSPRTVPTFGRAWQELVDTVADQLDGRQRLWVLQAGAGQRPLFDLPEDAYLVGVDRDPHALERNRRLDERVVADLTDYQPWAVGYDMVTCWYELDGVPDPGAVLDRFTTWTAEEGLVVLAVTNPRSLWGVWLRLTRRAPLRAKLAGPVLRRRFLRAGFTPVLHLYFEAGDHVHARRRWRITGRVWRIAQALTRIFSLGRLDAARTDQIVVFRRDG
jgi:hypothetical protein